MNSIFNTINNDLIVENEIIKTLENVELNKTNIFKNNYITHTVIHSYIIHTNIFNFDYLDLVTNTFPKKITIGNDIFDFKKLSKE